MVDRRSPSGQVRKTGPGCDWAALFDVETRFRVPHSSEEIGEREQRDPAEARCTECGFWNDPAEARCGRCGRPLDGLSAGVRTRRELEQSEALPNAPAPAPPKPPPAPQWKQELQQRLAGYREKQRQDRLPSPGPGASAKTESSSKKGSWINLPTKTGPKSGDQLPSRAAGSIPAPPADRKSPPLPPPPRERDSRRKNSPHSASSGSTSAATGRRLPLDPHIAPRGDDAIDDPPARPPTELERRLAPLAMRLVATLMDIAVVCVALGAFLTVANVIAPASLAIEEGPWVMAGAFLAILFFYWIFFLRFLGRTAGMTWMGLRVLDLDCRQPDDAQRRNRAFGTILSAAAVGVGFLWALADDQKLTWHDRMSKTFVALDPSEDSDE